MDASAARLRGDSGIETAVAIDENIVVPYFPAPGFHGAIRSARGYMPQPSFTGGMTVSLGL